MFHWVFQLLLLGGFAIAVAISPARALGALTPASSTADGSAAPQGDLAPADLSPVPAASAASAER